MQGPTHAISAGAAYITLGTYAWHLPFPYLATGTAVSIGAGVLSDSDQRGSCVARSFGGITEALAWVVHKISGGHREGTHTAVGDGICAALAVLALQLSRYHFTFHVGPFLIRASTGHTIMGLYLALLFGAGLKALRLIRRDRWREPIAVAAATAMATTGWDAHGVALAILVGTVAHAAGDSLTEHGVPWLEPVTSHEFHLLPGPLQISTGHFAERWLIAPALLAAFVLVGSHATALALGLAW